MYPIDEPSAYRCPCGCKIVRVELDNTDPKERQIRWRCEGCKKFFGPPWYAWQWEAPESGTALVGLPAWEDDAPVTESATPLAETIAMLQSRRREGVVVAIQRGAVAAMISAISISILLTTLLDRTSHLAQRSLI